MKVITLILLFIILFTTLAIGQTCVDFQSLTFGTQYGTPSGNTPGQVVFTENGIPVSVENFNFVSGGVAFNFSQVDTAFLGFGAGQTMHTNNINLLFDFSTLSFVPNLVSFEFADLGGDENISVNGQSIFAGQLTAAPSAIASGVTLSISTTAIQGGIRGTAVLRGNVNSLLIGGQEFWLDNICAEDTTVTSIGDNSTVDDYIPKNYGLSQNFPNPFNPETEIRFQLPKASHVVVRIFNTLGKEIRILTNTIYQAGSYAVRWDGKDKNGNKVSSGVYLYQLKADHFNQVKKMLFFK
ncbi:MAG: FlgD immunoglobulin-like domain containing protein [bacterium]